MVCRVMGKSGPPNMAVRPTPNSKLGVGLKLNLMPLIIGCLVSDRPMLTAMLPSCVFTKCCACLFGYPEFSAQPAPSI